ncbi:MAG: Wzz/FepE/Etk N-terminal domain-containing protein [Firmicutes bacterium]|nr:Wzz/FepE/Etk N-terminal domain-containing protein [Bacillota bacterium]
MDNEYFNFEYWLAILNKRRKVLLLIVAISLITGAAITVFSPPLYTAVSTIYFPAPSQPMLSGNLSQGLDADGLDAGSSLFGSMGQTSMQQYAITILQSRSLSDMVLDKFGEKLFTPERFKRNKRVQLYEMMKQPIKITMGADMVIKISVDSSDPALSSDIANFYVTQFKIFSRDAILTTAKNKRIHLAKQKELVKKRLAQYEDEVSRFETSKKVVDIDQETKVAIDSYGQLLLLSANLNSQKERAVSKLTTLREKLKQQAANMASTGNFSSIDDIPNMKDMLNTLTNKEIALLEAKQTYTDKHPKVIDLQKDVDTTRALIRKQVENYLSGVESNLVPRLIEAETDTLSLQAQCDALGSMIKSREKAMEKLPGTKLKLTRLQRKVKSEELILSLIEQELQKAKVEEARDDAEVQIMDAAVAPDYKSKPDVVYNIVLSLILGILFGIMICFYVEYTDRMIVKQSKA